MRRHQRSFSVSERERQWGARLRASFAASCRSARAYLIPRCAFNKSLLPVAVGVCYFISLPLISSIFMISDTDSFLSVFLHILVLVLIGLLLSIPGPCIRTMLMNVNKPHCRSTVIAISEVFNNVGRILGPVLFVYFCR